MTRLYTAFSNSFAEGKSSLNALYDYAMSIDSLNGLYLALDGSVDTSQVAATPQSQVLTWYDVSGSTNYLYASAANAPTFTVSDPLLNNQSSIDFGSTGDKQLLFKKAVKAKTVIIVYYIREHRAYLFYAPSNTPPPDPLFFDYLPSYGTSLWTSCSQTDNLAFNSSSRINTRPVTSATYLPLNFPRILSFNNLAGTGQAVTLSGIGGRKGLPNGGISTGGITDSVKGSIAAILTFDENLGTPELLQLELLLKDLYINYSGPSVTELKKFKYLLNDAVSFDFASITVDEWGQATSYEFMYPSTLALTFNGSVLEGTASTIYDSYVTVRITNNLNIQSTFNFPFEVVRPDPLVSTLPALSSIQLVLSSARNALDLERYGVYTDTQQDVFRWEDARRIGNIKTLQLNGTSGVYETSAAPSVILNDNDSYGLNTAVQGRSFLWVYLQQSYGTRSLLQGLPDRNGNGVLWTTASAGQIHGQTSVTKLVATVNKVPVNTLTFRNKLNKLSFITAYQPDNESITITGLSNIRGKLYFLVVWDRILSTEEFNDAVSVLADRYVPNQGPFIANDGREYRYTSDVVVDLRTKVVDLKNRALTYSLTQSHRGAVINGHLLSFTGVTDELLQFKIDVTNSDLETTELVFEVDVVLRTNPLYLTLKGYLLSLAAVPDITDIYLATADTLVKDSAGILLQWLDYRLNTRYGTFYGGSTSSLKVTDFKPSVQFSNSGGDYLDLHSSITSSDWVVVYIRDLGTTGNVFLLGNDTQASFGGTSDNLHTASLASTAVLFGNRYVNKAIQPNTYKLSPGALNIIYWHTTSPVTVDSIAKDRVFTSSSIKGSIPLVIALSNSLTQKDAALMDSIIRDYYDPVRFICLLHFNNNLVDVSTESKTITGNATYVNVSKFGSHALNLKTSILYVPNDGDLAYLNESFAISFQLLITSSLDANTSLYIYTQPGLSIYIKGDTLYVDTDTSSGTYLIAHILPASFYASQLTSSQYKHVELNRIFDYQTLRTRYELFVQGVKVGTHTTPYEYTQTTDPARIGSSLGSLASVSNIYLDEFAIFRRGYIHDVDFAPPSSEYVV